MFLVLGVVGYWSLKDLTSAQDFENELDSLDINNVADLQKAQSKKLETALLVIAEEKFWNGAKKMQLVFSFFA